MNVIDLFCGCGGLSAGFTRAGYNILAAFDAWQPAIDTYNANFDHEAVAFDLTDATNFVHHVKSLAIDMVIGGPPCQDFSSAGKRVEGERANLTTAFSEIVTGIRPSFFVMENVARAAKSDAYQEAKARFIDAGYGLTEMTLDASRCGVPQARKRFICVGHLGALEGFLEPFVGANLSSSKMTVRDYMADELDIEHYYRHPRNYNRRGVYSVDEPAATIRGVSRPVPKGYKGHPKDTAPISEAIRALSTYERSRIQTFPPTFRWIGSKTDVEQMIGNAVPVDLAFFIASRLKEYRHSLVRRAA